MYDQNDILGVGPRWNIIHWMVKVGAEEPQLLEDQLDMWIAKKCTGDYHQEYQKNVNKASWHTILDENSNAEIDPSAQESSDLESESEIANEEDSD